MNCGTCLRYLNCKHTDYAEKIKSQVLKDILTLDPREPFRIELICSEEIHSDGVVAASK